MLKTSIEIGSNKNLPEIKIKNGAPPLRERREALFFEKIIRMVWNKTSKKIVNDTRKLKFYFR